MKILLDYAYVQNVLFSFLSCKVFLFIKCYCLQINTRPYWLTKKKTHVGIPK